jgi:hypothetical protein
MSNLDAEKLKQTLGNPDDITFIGSLLMLITYGRSIVICLKYKVSLK